MDVLVYIGERTLPSFAFFLFGPLKDWIVPTHRGKGRLVFTQSADQMISLETYIPRNNALAAIWASSS